MAWTVRIGLYRSQPSPVAGAPPIRTLVLETGGRVGDTTVDEAPATGADESEDRVSWNCARTPSLVAALKRTDVVQYPYPAPLNETPPPPREDPVYYRIVGFDRPARTRIIIQGERIR